MYHRYKYTLEAAVKFKYGVIMAKNRKNTCSEVGNSVSRAFAFSSGSIPGPTALQM